MKSTKLLSFLNLLNGSIFGILIFIFIMINGLQSQEISTIGEIYDFEVGDIFHVNSYHSNSLGDSESTEYNYVIVDKYYSADGEDLNYEKYIVKREKFGIDTTWYYSYYNETFTYWNVDSIINFGVIDTVFSNPDLYNGRIINRYFYEDYTMYTLSYFVEGCGFARFNSFGPSSSNLSELVYFKKGNETWGEPNWLMSTNIDSNKENLDLKISPNPVRDNLNMVMSLDMDITIDLYSLTGEYLQTFEMNAKTFSMDVAGLSCGTYVLLVRTEKNIIHKLFVKE